MLSLHNTLKNSLALLLATGLLLAGCKPETPAAPAPLPPVVVPETPPQQNDDAKPAPGKAG